MTSILALMLTLVQTGPRPPYHDPVPGSVDAFLPGDYVALVRFVRREEEPPRPVRKPDPGSPSVDLYADSFRVIASNQPDAPKVVRVLSQRSKRSVSTQVVDVPPNKDATYLLMGVRGVWKSLRGGDFQRLVGVAPWQEIPAGADEVSLRRLQPTDATTIGLGKTPADVYLATRLLSLEAPLGTSAGAFDARFFADAVQSLRLAPQYNDPLGYAELSKRLASAAKARYLHAPGTDERVLLACITAALGNRAGYSLLADAFDKGALRNDPPTWLSVQALAQVELSERDLSSARVLSLAARTKDSAARQGLLRFVSGLPSTQQGWDSVRTLLNDPSPELVSLVLEYLASETSRPDLRPPALTSPQIGVSLARLNAFWRGKSLSDLRRLGRAKR